MAFYHKPNLVVMLVPTRRQRLRIWLASKLFGWARKLSEGIEPRFRANAQEAFLAADRQRNEMLVVSGRVTGSDVDDLQLDRIASVNKSLERR